MMKHFILCIGSLLIIGVTANAQTYSKETILISTVYGNMKVKLFNETPLHRDNFLKLIKKGFYDSLLFHRVINKFMIQGGDPDSRKAPGDTTPLGYGDTGQWIPSEFNRRLFHKKGMLAAAREGDDVNPEKESSGCQFYIVMGKVQDSLSLKKAEIRINKALVTKINYNVAFSNRSPELKKYYIKLELQGKTDSLSYARSQLTDPVSIREYEKSRHFTFNREQKKVYTTQGGSPHLDMNYTVFGEVVEGLDIIDKIAGVKTDKNDRPLEDIRMKVSIINPARLAKKLVKPNKL